MKAIVIYDMKRAIAKDGKQIATFRADMEHFRVITKFHKVVMGSTTAKIIGKPLEDRVNFVITSRPDLIPGDYVYIYPMSLAWYLKSGIISDAICIGGEKTYQELFEYFDTIYATQIFEDLKGDQFFPPINTTYENEPDYWFTTYESDIVLDEESGYRYKFYTYERKLKPVR